tara:strand:+ start:252 stop:662 length:411 start_codon:yes stop_codon:yes gene_type:complete
MNNLMRKYDGLIEVSTGGGCKSLGYSVNDSLAWLINPYDHEIKFGIEHELPGAETDECIFGLDFLETTGIEVIEALNKFNWALNHSRLDMKRPTTLYPTTLVNGRFFFFSDFESGYKKMVEITEAIREVAEHKAIT